MRLNEKEKFGKEDEEEKRAEALIDLNISTCTATVAGQRGCINNHHRQKKTKVIFAKFPSQVPQVGWQTQLGFYTLYKPRGERASGFSANVPFSNQVPISPSFGTRNILK